MLTTILSAIEENSVPMPKENFFHYKRKTIPSTLQLLLQIITQFGLKNTAVNTYGKCTGGSSDILYCATSFQIWFTVPANVVG